MKRSHCFELPLALGALLSGTLGGCFPELPEVEGQCRKEPRDVVDCRSEGYEPGVLLEVGLVGYSCSGEARPDLLEAGYDEGFPHGLICSEKGEVDGRETYCCTSAPVDCAYDPRSDCLNDTYGYECRGTNRPESLNPTITCGNGIRHGEIVDYCCSGEPQDDLCQQSDVVDCQDGLLGFLCSDGGLPRGEQLGSNKSRPDHYNFTCGTPGDAPNEGLETYCCFAPPLLRDGTNCVNHTSVPGCEENRFGFACYGPSTPEDEYLAMDCPDPGFSGVSREGFPATLYCCDFKEE